MAALLMPLAKGTVVHAYEHKGTRCIHLLHEAWIVHEEIANSSFCFDDVNRFTRWMYRFIESSRLG